MRHAAKLLTKNFVFAELCRLQPHLGYQAGHQVHLDPELCDGEVMQYILGAQPELHRHTERNMHGAVIDQYIIGSVGVVGIDAERVFNAD